MNRTILMGLLLVTLCAVSVWWGWRKLIDIPPQLPRDQSLKSQLSAVADGQKVMMLISDREIEVEVVKSPERIVQGLSGRNELGADAMLFILPKTEMPRFWMKEMKFDLDLVWLLDGRVLEVTAQVPAPDPQTPLSALPIYSPQQPANMVLEVPARKASEWGIIPEARLTVK